MQLIYIGSKILLNNLQLEKRVYWILITISICNGCDLLKYDLKNMENLNFPIHVVEIYNIGPDEEILLKFCNAGQFPFLCIIENGSVKRRWAGYFVDEEESFRIEQLQKILSSE